jgi:hypothetical protein
MSPMLPFIATPKKVIVQMLSNCQYRKTGPKSCFVVVLLVVETLLEYCIFGQFHHAFTVPGSLAQHAALHTLYSFPAISILSLVYKLIRERG